MYKRQEFASPFVRGQEALAGTPGFYVTFTITNPSDQEAEVSILGKLKNPVNRGMEQRRLRNQLTTEKGCAQIVMKSDSKKANASNGSLASVSYTHLEFGKFSRMQGSDFRDQQHGGETASQQGK